MGEGGKHKFTNINNCLLYVFPPEGALTDAGDGDGGVNKEGRTIPKQYICKYILYHVI